MDQLNGSSHYIKCTQKVNRFDLSHRTCVISTAVYVASLKTARNVAGQEVARLPPVVALPMADVSVTILIDTYNYARFIGRAIESALDQTYPAANIEILVIDDGSLDDTPRVVERYGPRVRYIWKPNGGQASALNRGFREARGDLICLLDADDYFYRDKVEGVVELYRDRPDAGLIFNRFDIVDTDGTTLLSAYPRATWTGCRVPPADIPAQLRALIVLGHPWTAITSAISLRRAVVRDLTIPEDLFPHSPDLYLGLVLPFATDVAVLERPATAYVYHGANVGLFRSSADNREIYRRQLDYIRSYVESIHGERFLTYGGRNIFGPRSDAPGGPRGRLALYLQESRTIARSAVASAVKRRSRLKLAAALLLPGFAFDAVQGMRAAAGRRRSRRVLGG